MGSDAHRSPAGAPSGELLNVFALVIYIPGPLGGFLDELRRELVPDYNPNAHVSVLPPRPLANPADWRVASEEARRLTGCHAPFRVELSQVRVFPQTDVIYLDLGAGSGELHQLHRAMNAGRLVFQDPFVYHPHVTLAQGADHDRVPELMDRAQRRWNGYGGDRGFLAERVMFVRNTVGDQWADMTELVLGRAAVCPKHGRVPPSVSLFRSNS
jgi:hypothetical protein